MRISLEAVAGWLTGKAVEAEGRLKMAKEGHGWDAICGIVSALLGEYLFFWIVIGKRQRIGAVAAVGVARLLRTSARARQEN
jgi:hypothetical protein